MRRRIVSSASVHLAALCYDTASSHSLLLWCQNNRNTLLLYKIKKRKKKKTTIATANSEAFKYLLTWQTCAAWHRHLPIYTHSTFCLRLQWSGHYVRFAQVSSESASHCVFTCAASAFRQIRGEFSRARVLRVEREFLNFLSQIKDFNDFWLCFATDLLYKMALL